jgi:hypothetical protein
MIVQNTANPFEVLYEDSEPTFTLKIIDLHCSDKFGYELKHGDLHYFYKCFPKDKYLNVWQKAAVCTTLFGGTFMTSLLTDEGK